MAAGLGFKTFATGEVLTAGDVNGYLMQGILVFASTAARDSAITSPQEGQFAFTKDTNSLWYYDGSAWVASGATGDIEGVTAGVGISGGGTSGTVTITNSMATAIDAKGDLVVGTGADTFSRLAVGTNNFILTADSAEATGMKWAAASAAGANFTLLNSPSGTALNPNASVTISGISGKDKILVMVTAANADTGSNNAFPRLRLNSDTGSNYYYNGFMTIGNSTYSSDSFIQMNGNPDTSFPLARWSGSSTSETYAYALFTGCNSSGVKTVQVSGGATRGGGTEQRSFSYGGYYSGSSTISSVTLFADGAFANYDGGTIYVYTSA